MGQTDLILAVLIGLSVLVGVSRGFCAEILNLTVYVLSGVSGYALIPFFRSVFTFIPYEPAQRGAAVLLGTFVSWLVLKMLANSLVGAVKKSSLKQLDRSLGGVFGVARAGVCIVLVYVVSFFCAPDLIEKSRILTLSAEEIKKIPELDFQDEKTALSFNVTKEDLNWKKRLLLHLQNKTISDEDGEKKLISVLSSQVAKEFSGFMIEEEGGNLSAAQKQRLSAEAFELQLTAWLSGKPSDGEEIKEKLQAKMLEIIKEESLKDEDSGD